jgi:hypothetical protein
MKRDKLIPIDLFCVNYDVEFSFLYELSEFGLVEIKTVDQRDYIQEEAISNLEKMIRLHAELGINMEGLDVIHHLLHRISHLENEINLMRNKLRFYED